MEAEQIEFLAKKYGQVLIKSKQILANGKYYLKLLDHGLICDFKPTQQLFRTGEHHRIDQTLKTMFPPQIRGISLSRNPLDQINSQRES